MNKRKFLLAVAISAMLAACGADNGQEDSTLRPGIESAEREPEESHLEAELPEDETATAKDGADSEPELPENETEIEESNLESTAGSEDAALTERIYEADIIYYDEASDGLHLRKDVEKTQTDYAVYYFELPIEAQERDACITATDRMLSCIDGELPDIEIAVLQQESYDGISISGNRLYLPPQSWDSADYLAKVLLAGCGGWGNYGMAYGYADYLCKTAEAENGKAHPGRQETDCFEALSTPEFYDMNLLCFDEKFVSPQDVEAAKNNACLFVNDYLSGHSEDELMELLRASGTTEGIVRANEVLEEFYAENGVECSLTEMRYQPGGAKAEYAAACEYACFYIYKDWQDRLWEADPKVSENFLHEDYTEVREFFECNTHQMQQYQELFGFDNYNNALSVYLKNLKTPSARSYYSGSHEHAIYLENVSSLMHEYIHAVMVGRFDDWGNNWKTEGFATYFSYKYNLYMNDYLNTVWNNAVNSIKYVQEYIDTIKRPIDMKTDFREMEDIMVHAYGQTNPDDSYQSGSSFIGYLADLYGEAAVITYVCSDNEYNAEWDKSYDELVQGWRKYIIDNYSQYSTIETHG